MNAWISDLFFNLSHDAHRDLFQKAEKDDRRVSDEAERAALMEEARWFADAMNALGVEAYEPDVYIDDFLARV